LPISETKKQNIGALLSHFGASRVKSLPQDSDI